MVRNDGHCLRSHLLFEWLSFGKLQCDAFSVRDMDSICESLTPNRFFNPHKSIFGLGNYDVNVIMQALVSYGLVVRWFNRNHAVRDLPFDNLYGLILNVPSESLSAFGSRHWYCLKRFASGRWFRFDSDAPLIKRRKDGTPASPAEKAIPFDDVSRQSAGDSC